ncbi:MAG: T9SS type A sorting domain-containing protein [Bacteroidota bacterium]
MKHIVQLFIFIITPFILFGQGNPGQYNVQFSLSSIDCDNDMLFLDVQVQAASGATEFRITDQNYRFSFNRGAIVPIDPPIIFPNTNPDDQSIYIHEELDLSGFVARDGAFSFFEAHTLTGSTDSVTSYNLRLAGGDGYPVYADEWVSVGRLRLYYGDNWLNDAGGPPPSTTSPVNDPIELSWHTHAPEDFPNTFIGEMYNGVKVAASEGNYYNFVYDPYAECGTILPIELAFFRARDLGCAIELEWQTDTETNNDYFVIEESSDGINYRPLVTVDGAGTTLTPRFYTFTDESVDLDNFYRLKQVDFDGTNTTSPAIYMQSSCFDENVVTGIADIFPNPLVPGKPLKLTVFTNKDVEDSEVLISDVLGRVVYRENAELVQGGNNLRIDLDHLAVGTYFVHVQGEDWISDPGKFLKLDK